MIWFPKCYYLKYVEHTEQFVFIVCAVCWIFKLSSYLYHGRYCFFFILRYNNSPQSLLWKCVRRRKSHINVNLRRWGIKDSNQKRIQTRFFFYFNCKFTLVFSIFPPFASYESGLRRISCGFFMFYLELFYYVFSMDIIDIT